MQASAVFQHGLETYPLPELREPLPQEQHLSLDTEPVQEAQSDTTTHGNGTRPRPHGSKRAVVEPGEDISHSRFWLPKVEGSFLQYPNKRVKYNPFPPRLDEVREKLFKIEPATLLDSQQIADYWPHVTNFWMRSTVPTAWHNGAVTEVLECRNRRRVTMKGKQNRSTGTGARVRQTKDELIGDVAKCQQRIKVTSYTKHAEGLNDTCKPGFGNCQCLPEWVYLKRTNKTVKDNHLHTHDIDLLDRYKRSDALMYYAKLKIEEGYSYTAVLKHIYERYGSVTSQAYHLSRADVGNVSRPWRLQNKDVELKTEVEEETFEQKRRRDCFDAIEATSQGALAKALAEVCRQIPQAVDVVAPLLEYPESDGVAGMSKIVEGNDLVLPPPGMPAKKVIVFESDQGAATTPPSTQPGQPVRAALPLPQTVNTLPSQQGLPLAIAQTPHLMSPPPMPSHNIPVATETRPRLPAASMSTDPEATSRAFINESSRTAPFAAPYQAGRPVLPHVRKSTSAQLWPPTSITPPAAQRSGSSASPSAPGGSSGPRPSWAASTIPQKRPIDAAKGNPPRPSPDKRTLPEEISAQLREELHGGHLMSRSR